MVYLTYRNLSHQVGGFFMAKVKHLVTLDALSVDEIMTILHRADDFVNGETLNLGKIVVANLFFEPSTRTQYSFEMAQKKLGAQTMTFHEGSSSTSKGESLYDTVKTIEALSVDTLVIRHPEVNYFEQLIPHLKIPLVNGGDGSGNHPSQSLLDLYTIWKEFGQLEGLNVAIAGDIANSRVAHSNIKAMERLGMVVHLIAPPQFQEKGYEWHDFDCLIDKVDVVMLLRVQHERHHSEMTLTKSEYHEQYGMTVDRMEKMKSTAIIMHPGPFNRGTEIADEVVEAKRSRIFKQVENGVYIRMAMLEYVLGSG